MEILKIFADINGEEHEFVFSLEDINGQKFWYGNVADKPLSLISLKVNSTPSELPEFSLLALSKDITTPAEVVFERFKEALAEVRDAIVAGLESESIEQATVVGAVQPYDPDSIRVRRETFSAFQINRMITEQEDIDLNPDFQRNVVWNNTQKSLLIESIFLGIPIPVFYFAESRTGTYHVVDGLQRLTTISQFFQNGFSLKNLEHITDCEGKFYSEDPENKKTFGKSIDRKYSRRLENAQLNINVIESSSPQKVKYDIFKRLNTGGRPLNHQEVRNCMAEPRVRKFLKRLAHSEEFKLSTGGSVSDQRMDAQELVMRFIGFSLMKENELSYAGDVNPFLDETLDLLNEYDVNTLRNFEERFVISMRRCYHLFGQYCFRKTLSEHLLPNAHKQLINKSLFSSWSIEVLEAKEKKIFSIPFGSFAPILAKELDKKKAYYTTVTIGTNSESSMKEASTFARQLLADNKLL